jgi:hypothetical protein
MRKLNLTSTQVAAAAMALAIIATTSFTLASPADAGSRNRDAFLKAAKKGYRGDPAVLKAYKAQHKAEQRATQSGIAKLKKAAHSEAMLNPAQKRKRYEEKWHQSQDPYKYANKQHRKKMQDPRYAFKHHGHEAGYQASPKGQRELNENAEFVVKAFKTRALMDALTGGNTDGD